MLESQIKSSMVYDIKHAGGFARRIEDKYGLGMPDCVFIPKGCPAVFFAEVKVIKGLQFGPTPRQLVELNRINNVKNPHAFGIMIGWKSGVTYFHEPADVIFMKDCFSVTSFDMPFDQQLEKFYYARLKK